MNKLPLFVIVASFFCMLAANAQEVSEEAVEVMKAKYYETFNDFLPQSRNCNRSDVEGMWVQLTAIEIAADGQRINHMSGQGQHLIRYGNYNQFVEAYSNSEIIPAEEALPFDAPGLLKQYIVSVRGLLYLYENNTLRSTQLCFVALETKNHYKTGDVLLMNLVKERVPQIVQQYRPVSMRAKKEENYVR